MFQHEVNALKKLGIPLKKWGDSYRIKVRGKTGRYTYISNLNKKFYKEQLVKEYGKVFKSGSATDKLYKLNRLLITHKSGYSSDKSKKKEIHDFVYMDFAKSTKKLEEILRSQTKAFKVNISLGYTLRNSQTGEKIYWSTNSNTHLYDKLQAINSKDDIQKIINNLRSTDLTSRINYPSSAYKLEEISGISAMIYIRDHRLGDDNIVIPDVIKSNRHIICHPKTNNKCVFYCIAALLNPTKHYMRLQGPVKELFKQYCAFKGIEYSLPLFKSFEGVDLLQFDELEDCFKLRINVFEMDINTETIHLIRGSTKDYEQKLNILDYNGHAMYVPRLENLENRHLCDKCGQIFSSTRKMVDHRKTKCEQESIASFDRFAKAYTPAENKIKTLLRKYDIKGTDHYIDHFIVYDFEAILKQDGEKHGESTTYMSKHIPVSVSINDSLTNKAHCFVSDSPKELLKQMFEYIDMVQSSISEYNTQKFDQLFKAIGDNDKDAKSLNDACGQIPILGFNSGRYDINLIKKDLFTVIGTSNIKMVIKNPSYMCIATDMFKMLDVSNYLPAGTSYDSYTKTYLGGCQCSDKIRCSCQLAKGHFCYEYITSFDKLNETKLPPKEAFDSKLKSTQLSDDEYERLQFVWDHNKMKSVKDLLVWYNNLDVIPFVAAVKKQREFYK